MKLIVYKVLLILFIKLFSVFVVLNVISNYIKFIDSELYLAGFYLDDKSFRNQIIQQITWSLNNLFGPFMTQYLFSIISAIGFIYYYITQGQRLSLLLFLFLPSTLIWTSVIGKESIFYGFFTLALIIIARFNNHSAKNIILLLISIAVCVLLRPHYALVLIWLFFSIYIFKNFNLKLSIFLVVGIYFFMIIFIYTNFWEELLFRGYSGINENARYSRFKYLEIIPNTSDGISHVNGFARFRDLISVTFIFGILGPMPFEILYRPSLFLFNLEGFLIIIFPFLLLFWTRRLLIKNKVLFYSIFVFCIIPSYFYLIWIHSPFGLLNFGSGLRWRVNFETLFYLFPLIFIDNFCLCKKN